MKSSNVLLKTCAAKNLMISVSKNVITLPNSIVTFFDTANYTSLLAESDENAVYVPMYNKKTRIGVALSELEAKNIIAKDKSKRLSEKEDAKKEAFLPPHLSIIERTGSSYNSLSFRWRSLDGEIWPAWRRIWQLYYFKRPYWLYKYGL